MRMALLHTAGILGALLGSPSATAQPLGGYYATDPAARPYRNGYALPPPYYVPPASYAPAPSLPLSNYAPRGYFSTLPESYGPRAYGYASPPVAAYAPPAPVLVPLRPSSCGEYRYWNGEYCADARYERPYLGPRW